MATPSAELLALALELEASGADHPTLVDALIEEAGGSAQTLLGACALAQSLTKTLPLDAKAERAYAALVESLRWTARHPGAVNGDGTREERSLPRLPR